jgi:predicted CXXCH cytochrome family protein
LEAIALVASLTLIFFGLGVIGISESNLTSPKAPQAHREAVCADCHRLVASTNSQDRFQTDMDAACVNCHTDLASQTSGQLAFHRLS